MTRGRSIGGYSHGGCLASVVLGYIGALLGMYLARTLRLPEPLMVQIGHTRFPVVWSVVGSALTKKLVAPIACPLDTSAVPSRAATVYLTSILRLNSWVASTLPRTERAGERSMRMISAFKVASASSPPTILNVPSC